MVTKRSTSEHNNLPIATATNINQPLYQMTPQMIMAAVTRGMGVTHVEMTGPRKHRQVADARKAFSYFCRKHTRLTNAEIAVWLGDRNRHCVMYGARVWQMLMETSKPVAAQTALINDLIERMQQQEAAA